jgi:hypothetical protein
VNGVAAEIELIGRVAAHRPQKGRRDQCGERRKILTLDRVQERRIEFVEGGIRLERIFKDDLGGVDLHRE